MVGERVQEYYRKTCLSQMKTPCIYIYVSIFFSSLLHTYSPEESPPSTRGEPSLVRDVLRLHICVIFSIFLKSDTLRTNVANSKTCRDTCHEEGRGAPISWGSSLEELYTNSESKLIWRRNTSKCKTWWTISWPTVGIRKLIILQKKDTIPTIWG